MKQSKGVVMRVTGKKTVVYTKEGDFLEIATPKNPPRVGQVIEVNTKPARFPSKQALYRYATVAAIMMLVLALGVFNPLLGPNLAVASVSLEINSGLELYVDKQARIVEVNVDSGPLKGVLEDLKLENLDLYQAVNLILKEARAKNVLFEDNNFVLASVIPIDAKGEKVVDETKLRNTIREAMVSKNISGVVMVGNTDQVTKAKAEKLNLTVNRYLVYERCQKDGVQIHADEIRQGDMQQVLADKNVSLPNLFPDDLLEVKHGDHSRSNGGNSGETNNGHKNIDSHNTLESKHEMDSGHATSQKMSYPAQEQKSLQQGQQESVMKQHEMSDLKEHENTLPPAPGSSTGTAPLNNIGEHADQSHEKMSNHN